MRYLRCIQKNLPWSTTSSSTSFTNSLALLSSSSVLPRLSLATTLQRHRQCSSNGFISTCQKRSFATSVDSSDSHSDFQAKAREVVNPEDSDAVELIKKDVSSNPVFLFMKGNPQFPRCGFSASVVRILQHLNVPFASRDVLENDSIRQAIKQFSDWPTLPQLYVKGEFVGGADIIGTLFKSGELETLFRDAGILPPISSNANASSASASPAS